MERLQRYRALIVACTIVVVTVSCVKTVHSEDANQESPRDTVILRNLDKPGTFEVENRGPAVALSSQVVVQELQDGTWHDGATDLVLLETCVWNPLAGCQTFEHGAKLRPVPWNGMSCGGQCPLGCRATLYLGPGQFRFVLTTCDRKQRFYGPAFVMPDYDHSDRKKKEG